jgi:hypothetical protein
MNYFCPDSKIAFKVERPSTRFTISSEVSTSKPREIIITDLAMGTEAHYSYASAVELYNAMGRALGKTVEPTVSRPFGRMTNRL